MRLCRQGAGYVFSVVGTSRCDVRAACNGATSSNASVARIFVPPATTRAGTAQRAIPTIALNTYGVLTPGNIPHGPQVRAHLDTTTGARAVPARNTSLGRGMLDNSRVFTPDKPLRTGTVRGSAVVVSRCAPQVPQGRLKDAV